MKVGINAQLLNTAQSYRGAGVSRYSQHLLQALGAANCTRDLTAFVTDPAFGVDGVTLRRASRPLHSPLARIAWEQTVLPRLLRTERFDLVHGLVNVLPLATHIPGVATVHDLSFVRMPQKFPAPKRLYLTLLCRWSARRAARLIAVSQQTAADLSHFFGIQAEKIDVVYNGVDDSFSPDASFDAEARAHLRRSHDLPERFVLYLGTLEPRKNLIRLVEAFALWRQQSAAARDAVLVLAGARGWDHLAIDQRIDALELGNHVRFVGFVDSQLLPIWYRAAHLFVYPSLFEGFGLPVLEAMACGTPVLCSRATSLLEVADDAALSVDATNVAELAHALQRLWGDDALREDLRNRGLARASHFSWQRSAAETLAVYDAALGDE